MGGNLAFSNSEFFFRFVIRKELLFRSAGAIVISLRY